MKIHQNINLQDRIPRPVVTTGTFDGVHRGHQQILQGLNNIAERVGGESVLFTFHPHPRMVLHPNDHGLRLLHTQKEKHQALEEAGIDHLIEVPFTKEFATLSARAYVYNILVGAIGVHTMVVGYDHRFGHGREGDINTMRILSNEYGFAVEEIPAHMIEELKVSSTKVRNALHAGDVQMAQLALGKPYRLGGIVVSGNRIGRTMGFPTANIQLEDPYKLIPAHGVYAVWARLGAEVYPAMMNIGFRPTIHEDPGLPTLEVHILGMERDLYGMELEVLFVNFVRKEMRFNDLGALQKQLQKDREHVTKLLV